MVVILNHIRCFKISQDLVGSALEDRIEKLKQPINGILELSEIYRRKSRKSIYQAVGGMIECQVLSANNLTFYYNNYLCTMALVT